MTVMRCRPFFLLSSFFLYFNPAPVLQPFSGTDSPGYRWDTVLCISFLFDKKSIGHKPSTSAKRCIEAVQRHYTNEKAVRISEPFFRCKHKKTPLRILNGVWCERWDLNPHVKDTRTSNVPVCLFQHSRIFSDLFNQSAFIL